MEFLQYPLVQAVVTGVLSAAVVDFAAFRSWKSWQDAASYSWGTAAWRWFQGAVVGLLVGLGINVGG